MEINIQNIPQALRSNARWCCWRYVERDGNITKAPFNPRTGYGAKTTEPATFGTFEQAIFSKDMNHYDGVGIGIFEGICAIDIDHCIKDGVFSDMAAKIYTLMDSYTEISPSGEGLRVIFTAPDFKFDREKYYINNRKIGLEVYLSGATNRYVTITGNAVRKTDIHDCSEALNEVLSLFMRKEVPLNRKTYTVPAMKLLFPDEIVVERAGKSKNGDRFKRLMDGDTSDYSGNDNAADIALCNILAFWCSGDEEQMDRIFRTSGLMRPKWDAKRGAETYGQLTIRRACERVTQNYSALRNASKQPMPIKPKQRGGVRDGW